MCDFLGGDSRSILVATVNRAKRISGNRSLSSNSSQTAIISICIVDLNTSPHGDDSEGHSFLVNSLYCVLYLHSSVCYVYCILFHWSVAICASMGLATGPQMLHFTCWPCYVYVLMETY